MTIPQKAIQISLFLSAIVVLLLSMACSKPEPELAPGKSSASVSTSVNGLASLTADPNPIVVTDGSGLGEAVISWRSTVTQVDVRVESANGKLFTTGGSTGSARTGKWVRKGSKFFLQDHNASDPTAAAATLATLSVDVR